MKKLALLFICAVVILALLPANAFAADDMAIDVEARQAGDGTVEFSFTVTNNSFSPLRMVQVILPGKRGVFTMTAGDETIEPGASLTRSTFFSVDSAEMSLPLVFALNAYGGPSAISGARMQTYAYLDLNNVLEEPSPAPVVTPRPVDSPTKPDIWGSCVADKQAVEQGEKVTLNLNVVNSGNVDLKEVQLIASPLNDKNALAGPFDLDVGQGKTASFEFTADEDVEITPVVKYVWAGQHLEEELAPLSVRIKSPAISVIAQCGDTTPAPGKETEINITVTNNTDESLSDLVLKDSMGIPISIVSTLSAHGKASTSIADKYYLPVTLVYSASAVGDDDRVYASSSDGIDITPALDEGSVTLEMTAAPDKTSVQSPLNVKFTLLIKNASEFDLFDLKISEGGLGEIAGDAMIAAGETKKYETHVTVSETTPFSFQAACRDITGKEHSVSAQTAVTLNADKPETFPLAPPEAAGRDYLPLLLIVLIIALLSAIISLIVVLLRRREPKRRR